MRRTPKTNGKRTRLKAGSSKIHRRVEEMAAAGLVEDQIVLRVGGGLDKNQLRRRYIDSLKRGRQMKVEAEIRMFEGGGLSLKEQEMKAAYFAGYGDPTWEKPDGYNLLTNETLAETKEKWALWLRQNRKGGRDDA